MIINLINLVKAITAQHLILYDLSDALKDINEHRLTKVSPIALRAPLCCCY
jgi:hypothetical protein